jgi:hypothetical protein
MTHAGVPGDRSEWLFPVVDLPLAAAAAAVNMLLQQFVWTFGVPEFRSSYGLGLALFGVFACAVLLVSRIVLSYRAGSSFGALWRSVVAIALIPAYALTLMVLLHQFLAMGSLSPRLRSDVAVAMGDGSAYAPSATALALVVIVQVCTNVCLVVWRACNRNRPGSSSRTSHGQ